MAAAGEAPKQWGHIVVVGASLAGLHAVQGLRRHGHRGAITLIGAEPHAPYDRPPLSKHVLLADRPRPPVLPVPPDLGAELRLTTPVAHLDSDRRQLYTEDGDRVGYDALVIATGAYARPWTGPGAHLTGLSYLRTLDDALVLRRRLDDPGTRHVVIAGGGFIGAEVAHAAARRGHHVTVIEQQSGLLHSQLGDLAGATVHAALVAAGVTIRTGTTVVGFDGDGSARLRTVHTGDGTALPADLAVAGLGMIPATGWLAGTAAVLTPHLVCDQYSAVRELGADGRVVAAGDVTRWPHPVFGGRPISVGHWSNAREQADIASHNVLHPDHPRPHAHIPTFWSDIGTLKIRSIGLPQTADEVTVLDGDPVSGRYLAAYTLAGTLVGAVSINRPRLLPVLHRQIAGDLFTTSPSR